MKNTIERYYFEKCHAFYKNAETIVCNLNMETTINWLETVRNTHEVKSIHTI